MKSKLIYFGLTRNSALKPALKELTDGVNRLYSASGQYKKEAVFNFEAEAPNDIMSKLSDQIKKLAADFDNMRIELSCSETELEELKNQTAALKNEAAASKKETEELKKQLDELKNTQMKNTAIQENKSFELESQLVKNENEKRLKLVKAIIKFRDQLLIFKDNAEDDKMNKLLANLYRETGRLLSENDVEILNDDGELSTDRHIVTGTVPTDDPGLVNKIESTFRDGYIFDGKMIRPQEIVVYIDKR